MCLRCLIFIFAWLRNPAVKHVSVFRWISAQSTLSCLAVWTERLQRAQAICHTGPKTHPVHICSFRNSSRGLTFILLEVPRCVCFLPPQNYLLSLHLPGPLLTPMVYFFCSCVLTPCMLWPSPILRILPYTWTTWLPVSLLFFWVCSFTASCPD